jgi:hypothetical protein
MRTALWFEIEGAATVHKTTILRDDSGYNIASACYTALVCVTHVVCPRALLTPCQSQARIVRLSQSGRWPSNLGLFSIERPH